jgi:hypothetical protein
VADSGNSLLQGVHDFFLTLFSTAEPAGTGAVLAFEPGGVMVAPADLKINPADATYSPAKATEEVTRLSDTIPSIANGVFESTLKSVEKLAWQIIYSSAPASSDATASVGAAKNQTQSVFENNAIGSFEGEVRYHPTSASPSDWYDPSVATNWAAYSASSSATPPPAPPEEGSAAPIPPSIPPLRWRILPQELEPILHPAMLATVLQPPSAAPSGPAPQEVAPMSSVLMRPEVRFAGADIPLTNVASAGVLAPLHATSIDKPVIEADSLNPAVLQSIQQRVVVPPAVAPAVTAQIAPAVRMASSLARAEQVASTISATASEQPVDAPDLSVSFKYCVVHLTRPWFPELLLFTKGWYIPGYSAGAFGTGNATDATALFPCLPVGFVAIQDLQITGSWTQADAAAAASSAFLGPFSLLGATSSTTAAGSTSYAVAGIQIIAWICEPLPSTPPNGDPGVGAPPAPATSGG